MATLRIRRHHYASVETINVDIAKCNPYRVRVLRRIIDGYAFGIYGHWIKKSDGQNRAALFENTQKIELKQLYIDRLNK